MGKRFVAIALAARAASSSLVSSSVKKMRCEDAVVSFSCTSPKNLARCGSVVFSE
jgi:hypothetical protein